MFVPCYSRTYSPNSLKEHSSSLEPILISRFLLNLRQVIDPTEDDTQSQSAHPSFSSRIFGNIGEELVHNTEDLGANFEETMWQPDDADINHHDNDVEEMGESSNQREEAAEASGSSK